MSRATHGELLQLAVSSVSSELWDLIKKEWEQDEKLRDLIEHIKLDPGRHPKYKWDNNMLTRKGKLVVGSTLQTKEVILEWLHSSLVGGHSGVRATEKRIKYLFYWKGMQRDVKAFIFKCELCSRYKNENVASPGLLQPLPIPEVVWHSITMDFVEGYSSRGDDERTED